MTVTRYNAEKIGNPFFAVMGGVTIVKLTTRGLVTANLKQETVG